MDALREEEVRTLKYVTGAGSNMPRLSGVMEQAMDYGNILVYSGIGQS